MKGFEADTTPHGVSLGDMIGISHPFLHINLHTIVHTWIIMAIIGLIVLLVPFILQRTRVGRYLLLGFITFFMDLTQQAVGYFAFNHFSFITALFIFIASCNVFSVIPWIEEPTSDINTTLALGLISFLYIQISSIHHHGIINYIKEEFFSPFFLMFPLHIIGKLASIISISFRLFGNIFGGTIITQIYFDLLSRSIILQLLATLTGLHLLITGFFVIFEGFLQAFVFTMLTATYLSIALNTQDEKGTP